jgi:hypothetical protein
MDALLKAYSDDVELLLADVCLTAAMHGLDDAVKVIAAHLREVPRTEGAALLAQSLSKTAVRNYPQAIALAQLVLDNPQLADLHGQAEAFRGLAQDLAAGRAPRPLSFGA